MLLVQHTGWKVVLLPEVEHTKREPGLGANLNVAGILW